MRLMMQLILAVCLSVGLSQWSPAAGEDFARWQAQIAQYKQWLDSLGPAGTGLWVRLDGKPRPQRLYVSKKFFRADAKTQQRFVETFSSYLAGHPEKSVLIDLYDASTNRWIGEYGWGGFKLYPEALKNLPTS